MSLSHVHGILGEQLAADYYLKRNYVIIERNYRSRYGEIDLIVKKDTLYVFCEVKTRQIDGLISPREAVTLKKQQRITKTALIFLNENHLSDPFMRFDVMEILLNKKHQVAKINCLEQAF